jgi:hypothetical protein
MPAGGCVFLDSRDLCRIYGRRPVICRTHGLALRRAPGAAPHYCGSNFTDGAPREEEILDETRITENLMRLNLAFCTLLGDRDLAGCRFALADVKAGRLPAALID